MNSNYQINGIRRVANGFVINYSEPYSTNEFICSDLEKVLVFIANFYPFHENPVGTYNKIQMTTEKK